MNISDIIKILENSELRSLFTPEQQRIMFLIIQKEGLKYINEHAKNIQQTGYENYANKSEISSFTLG